MMKLKCCAIAATIGLLVALGGHSSANESASFADAQAKLSALRARCDFSRDPRFEVLRGKDCLSIQECERPPTLSELTNTNYPTDQELDAMRLEIKEAEHCRSEPLIILRSMKLPNQILMIIVEYDLAGINILRLFLEGQMTWGEKRTSEYKLQLFAERHINEYSEARRQANVLRQRAAAAQLSAAISLLQDFNKNPSLSCHVLGGVTRDGVTTPGDFIICR